MQYREINKVPLEQASFHELKEVVCQAWNARIVVLLLVQLKAEGMVKSRIRREVRLNCRQFF
jgi:hypothetical protein